MKKLAFFLMLLFCAAIFAQMPVGQSHFDPVASIPRKADGENFLGDGDRQIQAFITAGDAAFNARDYETSEANYKNAVEIFEGNRNADSIDNWSVAKAYFMLGAVYYKAFENIKLDAANSNAMNKLIDAKTEALEVAEKYFAEAIKFEADEWTIRANYMIGRGLYDMADAVANQRLFGNNVQQLTSRILILRKLDKLYTRAIESFSQNIVWANERNMGGEYIDMSKQAMMEMAFKKGDIIEQVGLLFRDFPLPSGDHEYYMMEFEERCRMSFKRAIAVYEDALKMAADHGIADSPWLDFTRKRRVVIKKNILLP